LPDAVRAFLLVLASLKFVHVVVLKVLAEALPKISDPKGPEASLDSRKWSGTKQKSSTTTTSSSSSKPQKEKDDVVLNILKNIQTVQLQTKSEFESLVKRVDSMENAMNEPYCEDYDGYGHYGPDDFYSETQSDIGEDFRQPRW